jgi:hypothetical protein
MGPQLFESWHVTRFLVGIPPTYLNMLLQRKLYGITASVSGRRGDKNSRRFDEETVLGIALVWMLFRCGLRTDPVRRILNDIAETKHADASTAAIILLQADLRYLVITRDLRDPGGGDDLDLKVTATDWQEDVADIVAKNPTESVLVLPVREIFASVHRGMALIQGG